jgi:2-polyprenyl-6-methoxyphenol hydroxylase-like FAD-dependent oxidoreductase
MTSRSSETMKGSAASLETTCCIAGGGPAGMMLGLLLARAGVDVLVLEKHADFLRDFRGDTIHPSTLELIHELGLLEAFLRLPHERVTELRAQIGDESFPIADFRHLPTRCRFIALMPQWDFLDFLAHEAARYRGFGLRMPAEATGLIEQAERIVGLRARTPDGPLEVRADLVVAADGRHSALRSDAGLEVRDLGAPMDVLWFRLPRQPSDPDQPMGRLGSGHFLAMINRGEYWQCGYVIPKGSLDRLHERGLQAFRSEVATLAPFVADRVAALGDWGELKPLTVRVDRLTRWYRPGLLCIGDAAHAMSPIGGVGINLAIQDAVAAANLLALPLLERRLETGDLDRVQRRRELPTKVIQRLQLLLQDRVIAPLLAGGGAPLTPPLALRLLARLPALRRIPARLIGMGVRPEHIAPELKPHNPT